MAHLGGSKAILVSAGVCNKVIQTNRASVIRCRYSACNLEAVEVYALLPLLGSAVLVKLARLLTVKLNGRDKLKLARLAIFIGGSVVDPTLKVAVILLEQGIAIIVIYLVSVLVKLGECGIGVVHNNGYMHPILGERAYRLCLEDGGTLLILLKSIELAIIDTEEHRVLAVLRATTGSTGIKQVGEVAIVIRHYVHLYDISYIVGATHCPLRVGVLRGANFQSHKVVVVIGSANLMVYIEVTTSVNIAHTILRAPALVKRSLIKKLKVRVFLLHSIYGVLHLCVTTVGHSVIGILTGLGKSKDREHRYYKRQNKKQRENSSKCSFHISS